MRRIVILVPLIFIVVSCASSSIRYTVEEIKGLPPEVQEKIKKSEVSLGMTLLQVRYSWGAPHVVNVLPPTQEGFDSVEWTYKKMGYFRTTLTFENNKLIEIKSNEPGVIK